MAIREKPVPFSIHRARRPRTRPRNRWTNAKGSSDQQYPAKKVFDPFDPANYTTPRHPYHTLPIDGINNDIKDICNSIYKALGFPQPKVSYNQKLLECLQKCLDGPSLKLTVVSLGGQQGIGKSTLINAMLGVQVADVSGDVHACTQYASRYVYKPLTENASDLFDFTLKFLNVDTLSDVIQEHARRFAEYHFPTEDGDELPDDFDGPRSTTEKENFATSAETAFNIIFNAEHDAKAAIELEHLLNRKSIEDGRLLHRTLKVARDRIRKLGADENGILRCEDVSLEDLKALKNLAKSNFVLVDHAEIAVGATILKNGLVLVDSPGDGDRNQTRKALANKLRREADIEIFLVPYKRLMGLDGVKKGIERSKKTRSAGNTIVVIAQIDTIDVTKEYVEDVITTQRRGQCAEVRMRRAEVLAGIDAGDIDPDDQATSDALDAYDKYLTSSAKTACIHDKANEAASMLLEEHGDTIKVYCVSATEYHISLDADRDDDSQWSPWMTGIPALTHYLLDIPAERNYLSYENHLFRMLPDLSDKLHHQLHQHKDDDGFVMVRELLAQHVRDFQQSLPTYVTTRLKGVVPEIWQSHLEPKLLTLVEKAIKDFSLGRKWNTYSMLVKERGIPPTGRYTSLRGQDVNWNRDLLETIEPAYGRGFVTAWNDEVQRKSTAVITDLERRISKFFGRVFKAIDQASYDPKLKHLVGKEWRKVEDNIWDLHRSLVDDCRRIIMSVYRTVITEEDIGCFIATQERIVYSKAQNQQRGPGFAARQRRAMLAGLKKPNRNGQTFIDRYQQEAIYMMKSHLEAIMNGFTENVLVQLDDFIDVTEQLVAGPTYESRETATMKKRLAKAKTSFDDLVSQLQDMWPGRKGQHDVALIREIKKHKTGPQKNASQRRITTNSNDEVVKIKKENWFT